MVTQRPGVKDPASGWVTNHAPRMEALDLCVSCGLCLPVCPTFRLTGDETASPRGRINAMKAVATDGMAVDERFRDMMSMCLQCRACETACPSMVPFGEVMEASRAEVEAQAPQRRSWIRRQVLVRVLRSRLLLRLATIGAAFMQRLGLLRRLPMVGSQTRGLRRITVPVRTTAGGRWGGPSGDLAMLLSGCVADVWFSDVHKATIEVLVAAGYRVEAPTNQTCCGALAAHGGFADDARSMAAQNLAAFKAADIIVTDVAGCGAHLRTYDRLGGEFAVLAAKVRDINDIVAEAVNDGRLPSYPPSGRMIGIQDPCHLEHGVRAHTTVDVVVEAAGCTPVPIDRGGLCCGAAGIYQIEHPTVSNTLGQAKANQIVGSGVTTVVSANAGCAMQLRRFLDGGYQLLHPVELFRNRMTQHNDAANTD